MHQEDMLSETYIDLESHGEFVSGLRIGKLVLFFLTSRGPKYVRRPFMFCKWAAPW